MALEGELPVVDDAGALGGQMRGQAGLDQAVQQRARAVLDKVRAVGEHDRRLAIARGEHLLGQVVDLPADGRIARRGRGGRLGRQFGQVQQVAAHGEGLNEKLERINGGIGHGVE